MAGNGRKGRHTADPELILRLAKGDSVPEVATATGVSERTIYRRLNDKEFAAAIDLKRTQAMSMAYGRLAFSSRRAAEVMDDLKEKSEDPRADAVRLGAANSVINQAIKLNESDTAARLLAEVVEDVAALKGKRDGLQHHDDSEGTQGSAGDEAPAEASPPDPG